jgi:CRP-like cAMP-binding protein
MLTVVEKVIFLQEVDIFKNSTTEDLALIAAITQEIELTKDSVIYKEGEIADSMFLVIEGSVLLNREGKELLVSKQKDAIGAWSLLDDEPRVVTAIALEDCRLLKIDKDDFIDLLADNVQITQGILKTIVKRLRNLLTRIELQGTS